MKPSKCLSAMICVSTIWSWLAIESIAQVSIKLPGINPSAANSEQRTSPPANHQEDGSGSAEPTPDLKLSAIGITRDRSDKSLFTVTGEISNRSDRSHYVYYIVAKLISKETSIKQTIIPINSQLEPGESARFNHEISTDNIKSNNLNTVTPVIVKYEYR